MFNFVGNVIDVVLLVVLGVALFIGIVYGLDLLFGWPFLSVQSLVTGLMLLGVFPGFVAYKEAGIRGLVTACFIQIFVVCGLFLIVYGLLYSINPSSVSGWWLSLNSTIGIFVMAGVMAYMCAVPRPARELLPRVKSDRPKVHNAMDMRKLKPPFMGLRRY